MTYNPHDENNRRDEVEANIERNRLERDGFIARPITRTLPPTAGTAEDADARGPQPHPAAGDALTGEGGEVMTADQAFNESLEEIMDWFDFSDTARCFIAIDFGWVVDHLSGGGDFHTVAVQLREDARRLLRSAFDSATKHECLCTHGGGGFEASAYPNGSLKLSAVIHDWHVDQGGEE